MILSKGIGIDLGTTNSAVAVMDPTNTQVLVHTDGVGRTTTPSCVWRNPATGELAVGHHAFQRRGSHPEPVRSVKRNMGSEVMSDLSGTPASPVEISSMILAELRAQAAEDVAAFGAEDVRYTVDRAIITVPAYFGLPAIEATRAAGQMAGLEVLELLNEPTAGAIHYCWKHDISEGLFLVYDLGGGTFDVTILDINGREIYIICSQGDHALGGVDFDNKILETLQKSYREKFSAELVRSAEDQAKYEDESEDIKKTLSRRQVAKKMLYGPEGTHKIEITRAMFEEAICSLTARIDMLLDVALEEAGLETSDIDKVLLVGGSTRIPLVQNQLQKRFAIEPETTVNVDECVALGAALHAGLTMLREKPDEVPAGIASGLGDIRLTDVCNHSYGTICAPIDKETGKHVVENRIILRKNTPLPCEATQMFYTITEGQTEVEVNITQGEDTDVRYVNKIAKHKFELPPGRKAKCPIKVTYSYDVNQRMHCRFEDLESGRTLEVEFCLDQSGQLSQSKVKEKARQLEAVKVE